MAVIEASTGAIGQAADALRAGRLVAFPTETVYGLGADAGNGRAVAAIYDAKGRPRFNPLIVHVADLAAAERIGYFDAVSTTLARAFWPGALTLVLARRPESGIAGLVTAGLDTIALRVPRHAVAQSLLAAAGCAIAAPSANRSGHVSPTEAAHVLADLGQRPAMILDGGPTGIGLESTVVDVTRSPIALLRPGGVAAAAIEAAIGQALVRAAGGGTRPAAPGQLDSHYAPRARLRLDAAASRPGEALLAFGPHAPDAEGPAINLSPAGDLAEAAARFFAALRTLDGSGADVIAVMPIPEVGLGEAINDRLRRAAAGLEALS